MHNNKFYVSILFYVTIIALGQNICTFKKTKQMIHLHATGNTN